MIILPETSLAGAKCLRKMRLAVSEIELSVAKMNDRPSISLAWPAAAHLQNIDTW
jgi:hypothetical protein